MEVIYLSDVDEGGETVFKKEGIDGGCGSDGSDGYQSSDGSLNG